MNCSPLLSVSHSFAAVESWTAWPDVRHYFWLDSFSNVIRFTAPENRQQSSGSPQRGTRILKSWNIPTDARKKISSRIAREHLTQSQPPYKSNNTLRSHITPPSLPPPLSPKTKDRERKKKRKKGRESTIILINPKEAIKESWRTQAEPYLKHPKLSILKIRNSLRFIQESRPITIESCGKNLNLAVRLATLNENRRNVLKLWINLGSRWIEIDWRLLSTLK